MKRLSLSVNKAIPGYNGLKRLKTKTRSITQIDWLNNSIFLYVYQERNIKFDSLGMTRGKGDSVCYKFYNMRIDTLLGGE